MENSKLILMYDLLNLLEKIQSYPTLSRFNKELFTNRLHNSLKSFLNNFIKYISNRESQVVLDKSLLYRYLKDSESIEEFEDYEMDSRYVDEENIEPLDEKILADCVISNIFQDFNKSVENYLDTIFCLKVILDKHNCLDKAIEILESVE